MEKTMLIKYKLKACVAIAKTIVDDITILVPAKTGIRGYILMIK